jgi:hypothetical protein
MVSSVVITGKWQWELHQRHQHLLRQYQQQGRATAGLDAAVAAIVAATLQQRQQQLDTDGNILDKMAMPTGGAWGCSTADAGRAIVLIAYRLAGLVHLTFRACWCGMDTLSFCLCSRKALE